MHDKSVDRTTKLAWAGWESYPEKNKKTDLKMENPKSLRGKGALLKRKRWI